MTRIRAPRAQWAARGAMAAALLCLLFPQAAGAQAKADLGPGGPAPFKHTSHVPGAWARWDTKLGSFETDEFEADCLGCHKTSNPTGVESVLCLRCHYEKFEAQGERPARDEKNALFQHREHAGDLVCRHCHSQRDAKGAVLRGAAVREDMSVVAGTTFCLACHGPQAKELYARWVAPERNDVVLEAAGRRSDGVLARLNLAPQLGPRKFDGVGFFHADHMAGWPVDGALPRAAEPGKCEACHAGVAGTVSACESLAGRDAKTALGTVIFDAAACAGCHVTKGAGGAVEPQGLALAERQWISSTAGTFSHKDHLQNPAPGKVPGLDSKRALIAEKGCFACHEIGGKDSKASYIVRGAFSAVANGKSGYDACASCHETWKVSPQPGFAGEKEHFAIRSDTSACEACHKLGHVTDMKAIPFQVRVSRKRELTFEIKEHAHEFITAKEKNVGKRAAVVEDCSKCHRSELVTQPSRIRKARFSHASHLPREAKPEDCAQCHGGIASTKGPDEISAALYDSKACAKCHKDVSLEPQADSKAAEIVAPFFAHDDHVGKKMPDGTAVSCTTCHESQVADGSRTVGVLEKALRCVTCHDHSKAAAITGGASGAYVASCIACHATGVPRGGTRLSAGARIAVGGILGQQLHPDPSRRPCAECHAVAVNGQTEVRGDGSPELLVGRGWFTGIQGARGFHDSTGGNTFANNDCFCCHWANQGESQERYRRPRGMESYTLPDLREKAGALFKPKVEDSLFPGRACAGR